MSVMPERIIFAHKHATSARTRFLRFRVQTVCGFSPLPRLSQLLSSEVISQRPVTESHPSLTLNRAAEHLSLSPSVMALEPEFSVWVDAPGDPIHIRLARFTDIDPPFEPVKGIGAQFIDLTEARNLPSIELLLLRRAYEVLLGG